MRELWSEANKRRLWRHIWVALARSQMEFGLVQPEQVAELEAHANDIDIPRALEIEADLHHDLMSEIRTFAEQCPSAGGIIHLGATSMDIEDNADAIRLRSALDLLLSQLQDLLVAFAQKIQVHAQTPVMAFTHLQPAEPTTLGYRLASYTQDLQSDYDEIAHCRELVKGKGFKGAVGTAASYVELVGINGYAKLESRLGQLLELPFYAITTQTYPRKQDYQILCALSGLGASLYKFAFDLRLMQSPVIGEWGEPFGRRQVGSSAMPFKRNPIHSEKIDSLARALAVMPQTAWHNAAHSLLERTLDDSANRRSLLPEAFLICDELVRTSHRLITGLVVNEAVIERNTAIYAPFASTEPLLMTLVKAGADRQEMHERLREHAMNAWEAVRQGKNNPLADGIVNDPIFISFIPKAEIQKLMRVDGYSGIAAERATEIAARILQAFDQK